MMSGFLPLSIFNWAINVIHVKKTVRERHAHICHLGFSKLHVKRNPANNTDVVNAKTASFFLRK